MLGQVTLSQHPLVGSSDNDYGDSDNYDDCDDDGGGG